MPIATIAGAQIRYETLGTTGPWCILNPGGRFALDGARQHAQWLADGGYRAIIYDRRNCGASDVYIGPEASEDEVFAGDMAALLRLCGGEAAFVAGAGGGNRPTIDFALRYPELCLGCMIVFPSGGAHSAAMLAQLYYGQFADAAEQGGMKAVCATDYYRERIAANPRNRELLLAMDAGEFIATMHRWDALMRASADWPTTGFTAERLGQMTVPALVFPGLIDDNIHGRGPGLATASAISGAQVVELAENRKPADDDGAWFLPAMRKRMTDPELGPAMLNFMNEVMAARSQPA
jgi:pimeloyl-ACP methyl ester carboxylesterase